ncbi:type II toxin-antitoxin system RelB/DinJ family antitoxin [Romeria aff. gracilis LEGE 07310]|uniref:Type II toxin-antitoxin system RelB/DinJ family antitoxin n=1 Tax=Vasconcelosia minhoensis LEGE 07310 TaxID=915328 RepID=A0A8J7DNX0_9CYAN|nr:type II toxin-antitoxin system RelB/DinJ family antitoxin [Romeria gracilis]MBE9080301.1 type II toxin-antitoxin system RelB/DinJ family antitoxin [Romeria aff. gracilis LEGE 07310]
MAKEATVRARIDPELKAEVEHLFKELGISTTEAITLFYHQVKLRNGLPFDVVIPNKMTEKVFKDTDAGENIVRFNDASEMFDQLGI